MSNNINVTPGTGKTVATEDIGGLQLQRIKLVLGASGVDDGDVESGNPLPVDGSSVTQPISAVSLPLPTGAATAANQSTANTSLASIDSKLTAPLTVITNSLDVLDFFDTNPVLDASSTNIPDNASLPLEVVASLAANIKKIKINDTTGYFIGIYTGPAASEVLQCISGPGEDGTIDVKMNATERVSLRAMAGSPIVIGELSIQFIG